MPNIESTKTTIGSSNATPTASIMSVAKSQYSWMVTTGWNSCPKPTRNANALGKASLYAKNPPEINRLLVRRTNGQTYFFS